MALSFAVSPHYPTKQEEARVSYEFMVKDLARSGLTPEDVGAYPIAPIAFGSVGGYCLPYHHNPEMYRARYDRDENKYIGPKDLTDIWIPPALTLQDLKAAQTIWIVEGEKKAAKFYKHFNFPTIGIGGCWMFQTQGVFLPHFLEILEQGKHIKVIFDSDIYTKPGVQRAAQRLSQMLDMIRVSLTIYTVPSRTKMPRPDGVTQIAPIKGLDDLLVADPSTTINDLEVVKPDEFTQRLSELYIRLGCHMDAKNRVIPNEANAYRLIPELVGHALRNDQYLGLIYDDGEHKHDQPDNMASQVLMTLQTYANSQFKKSVVYNAIGLLESHADKYNPVLNWFKTLKWDGQPRLCTWAAEHLTAVDILPDYVNEWGRLLISGIVARTIRPGCQQDYAFILAGPQGIGKTTLFRDLAHIEGMDYYVEYTPGKNIASESEQRAQGAVFRRNIIVDFSEGVLLKKYSSEEVKSIITRREDQFRKMYSISMERIPRHAICVGTTNQNDLLYDNSGSRRFVILQVSAIQRMTNAYKEQLFAEAYARRTEFFSPTWHEIVAQMPEFSGDRHVTNAQQAYNEKYHQHNEFQELLLEFIRNAERPRVMFEHNGQEIEVFHRRQIYDAVLSRMSVPANQQATNFILAAAKSVSFPYIMENTRKAFSKMMFPNEALRQLFRDSINGGDGTVRVIFFTPKGGA